MPNINNIIYINISHIEIIEEIKKSWTSCTYEKISFPVSGTTVMRLHESIFVTFIKWLTRNFNVCTTILSLNNQIKFALAL